MECVGVGRWARWGGAGGAVDAKVGKVVRGTGLLIGMVTTVGAGPRAGRAAGRAAGRLEWIGG